jgi:poly-gamma-glutamate synthesis protein (capsule biosynthesis protein)
MADGSVTLALLGDTMLGRGVGEMIARGADPADLVDPAIVELLAAADVRVLNLECCISDRGERWPALGKPFFFRAPPRAVDLLRWMGIDAVTLANNHALDYGFDALADTLRLLDEADIDHVGAGVDVESARRPAHVATAGAVVRLVALADHPDDFAARPTRPGTALWDLGLPVPDWLASTLVEGRERDELVLVSPHWGPNMRRDPLPSVVAAADALVDLGTDLVAGHSAHVVQGGRGRVLFDLGDFLDDYAVDPVLRNDLGLIWLVTLDGRRAAPRLEAVPIRIHRCRARLADRAEWRWMRDRLRDACHPFGTDVAAEDGRLALVSP